MEDEKIIVRPDPDMEEMVPWYLEKVSEYAKFAATSINHLNRTLKELSGGAVTPQEAERLKVELPNPGTGIFDGDSPAEFEAKMSRAIQAQKMALLRYTMWEAQGAVGNPWDMGTIEEMPALIGEITNEITRRVRAEGFTDDTVVRQRVLNILATEYGIRG